MPIFVEIEETGETIRVGSERWYQFELERRQNYLLEAGVPLSSAHDSDDTLVFGYGGEDDIETSAPDTDEEPLIELWLLERPSEVPVLQSPAVQQPLPRVAGSRCECPSLQVVSGGYGGFRFGWGDVGSLADIWVEERF